MSRALRRLGSELGPVGLALLALLLSAAAFLVLAVRPLEQRARQLDDQLRVAARLPPSHGPKVLATPEMALKVAAFYTHFERAERTDEWLAKLYGIAAASGLELRAAEYRLAESRHRIERYRIVLPVSGSYAQVRGFLEAALDEIPVLSLDQASFRRRSADESRVECEIVLTLHLLRR